MLLIQFLKDRKAGVAPLLALGLVPLFGAVGAAVDYSHANAARSSMQAALDASALMLAKEVQTNSNQSVTDATSYFNSNFVRTDVQNLALTYGTSSASGGGTTVSLSATGSVRTTIMGVMGFTAIPLSVHSAVTVNADGLGCVLSLDPTAPGATTGQGSTSVSLNSCSLYDNSNNAAALTVGGSATVSALSIGVVGGI